MFWSDYFSSLMAELNILSGNINSIFRGKNIKFDNNLLNEYDIGIFIDARVNLDRLKVLKSKFNFFDKPNQFYTCLSREVCPKHGVLIYINSSKLLRVIECNNQSFVHNEPRIGYAVCELNGWGLTAIIGAYLPANGGVGHKIRIYEILIRVLKRLLETYSMGGISKLSWVQTSICPLTLCQMALPT